MNLFDIMGPVMVGPSSSHTAGAVRIGNMARHLLGEEPARVDIALHGSFAATGYGHGTDKAIVAGLLGLKSDDVRIPESFSLAKEANMDFTLREVNLRGAHPNTALITLEGRSGRTLKIQASSLGGGRIFVNKLDDIEVNFSGDYHTLIVHNEDTPGHVSAVTTMLSRQNVNIANMSLYRNHRGGYAVMVVELDQPLPEESLRWLGTVEGILKVTYFNKEAE